ETGTIDPAGAFPSPIIPGSLESGHSPHIIVPQPVRFNLAAGKEKRNGKQDRSEQQGDPDRLLLPRENHEPQPHRHKAAKDGKPENRAAQWIERESENSGTRSERADQDEKPPPHFFGSLRPSPMT